MSSSSPQSSPARRSTRSRSRSRSRNPAQSSSSPLRYGQQREEEEGGMMRSSSPITTSPVRLGIAAAASSSPLPYGHQTPGGTSQSGMVPGTPVRARGELGAGARRLHEFDPSSGGAGGPSSRADAGMTSGGVAGSSDSGLLSRTVIWGTDVNVRETMSKFKTFLRTFPGANDTFKYMRQLEQLEITGELFLNIDCEDLREFDMGLYNQLVRYPQEIVPTFDIAANDLYTELINAENENYIQVRTFNLAEFTSMRDLNPDDIDQLVAVKGMVIRTSAVIPDMKEAFFECIVCKNPQIVGIDRGHIAEPQSCSNCQSQRTMQLIHNRCRFSDKQMIKLQETPERVPDGQTPQTILTFAYDNLVDAVQPGDRVEVTGIYRATPLRLNPRQRTVKAVYKTYLDVIHFKTSNDSRMRSLLDEAAENEDPEVLKEKEAELRELSRQPDIFQRLANALAPNIFGYEDVKRGILLQLLGGAVSGRTHSNIGGEPGKGGARGEINVLLCGDPGTSKSQLLQYAVHLAPRGIYTSGKGSSSVGLTAYVTKDPDTKQLVLESGALVLCDGGMCCIDEFDKMPDGTRSVLHEAMEQQTVSIAKAGIICTLNARTSILAAANPVDSRWNSQRSIVENIQLPPTLLSRFDLIYLILDTPDRDKDRRLAEHLVALYYPEEDRPASAIDDINRKTLASYISMARREIKPVLSDKAMALLVRHYVSMRKAGESRKTITATPRQLESLIRLSEAHARLRLSNIVEEDDVEEAFRLVREALKQAATDPQTGIVDMDLITTGQSSAARKQMYHLMKAVSDILGSASSGSMMFRDILDKINETAGEHVTNEALRNAIGVMVRDESVALAAGADLHHPNPTLRFVAPAHD